MKKTLLSLAVLLAAASQAQTVTFDDLSLDPETYNNGSALDGQFQSGSVTFRNEYDPSFGGYWSGAFVYSNSTDVTTAGYTNGHSAYLSTPSATGNIYAAYYTSYFGGSVDCGTEVNPGTVKLTNTTFAALSMRDGDTYGKQFGSSTNANGDVDGTNGEDFFLVNIIGLDGDSLAVDTVTFYLADYRFADNTQDYIVDEWTTVDLSGLAGSRYLAFSFGSSDVNPFGINTPTYFAMDDLTYSAPLAVPQLIQNVAVYPNPAAELITIESEAGRVRILDASEKEVLNATTTGIVSLTVSNLAPGAYTVELRNAASTGRRQFIKR